MHERGSTTLQRALEDLGEGLRALFGLDGEAPRLVDELLADGGEAKTRAPARRRLPPRHGPRRRLSRVK